MATQVQSNNAPGQAILLALSLWAAAVSVAAVQGWLAAMPNIGVPTITATGIALPMLVYANSPAIRAWFEGVGIKWLTAFHGWRIAAAFLFFGLGAAGGLPPLLVQDAAGAI